MRTAPAAVVTFINANNVAWKADLYTLTLVDGTILRWTTADADLVVGGNTYSSAGAVVGRDGLRATSRLEVDALRVELNGAFVVNGKTLFANVIAGLFDETRVQLDHLVGSDARNAIALGPIMAWWEGRVAGIDPTPTRIRLTVASELELMDSVVLPRFAYLPGCGNAVYDPVCGLNKATFTIAGTSTGGTTTTVTSTTAGIIAKANGYFDLGVLVFTSGPLLNTRRSIRSFSVSAGVATFTLGVPLPSAPGAVNISAYPGCHLNEVDCGPAKFNNFVNFRGFNHIPTPEGGI
jgi:uncharacterized phage protein (TIGR02218 family)